MSRPLPWLEVDIALSCGDLAAGAARLLAAGQRLGVRWVRLSAGRGAPRQVPAAWRAALAGFAEVELWRGGQSPPTLPEVGRLAVAVPSLRARRFREVAGGDLARALGALEEGLQQAPDEIIVDVPLLRGVNDDELEDLAALALDRPLLVRFAPPPEASSFPAAWAEERAVRRLGLRPAGEDERFFPPPVRYRAPGAAGAVLFLSAAQRYRAVTVTAEGELVAGGWRAAARDLLLRPAPMGEMEGLLVRALAAADGLPAAASEAEGGR